MNCKPDNKCVNCEDITLLSEIITDYRYWQEYQKSNIKNPTNSGQIRIISSISLKFR
jgi:hypothetical protein